MPSTVQTTSVRACVHVFVCVYMSVAELLTRASHWHLPIPEATQGSSQAPSPHRPPIPAACQRPACTGPSWRELHTSWAAAPGLAQRGPGAPAVSAGSGVLSADRKVDGQACGAAHGGRIAVQRQSPKARHQPRSLRGGVGRLHSNNVPCRPRSHRTNPRLLFHLQT